ncbi:TRAP transporter fused permease subunit [Halalkalicoccus sp. NIPERK01]|uniref:TRAP transporter permease n=1 Tax=Halalkalicoccus sp. NIPERK01 TaxID=3053469 RepID=UPI00256ED371|nr:TRAP transporter fused permease subunit [Halalkalicoccus sp. NIPERK01]MDL5360702.1 TRAP transporter fused permease subunit [Halalkalicoccus sp. NIPERK01]
MSSQPPDSQALSAEEQEQLLEEIERKRSLTGKAAILVAVVGVLFSAYQIWLVARGTTFYVAVPFTDVRYTITSLQQLQRDSIHVAFALVLAFLLFPTSTGDGRVARAGSEVVRGVRNRFGADSPLTTITDRLADGVRWAVMDADRERITPVDVLLILLTVMSPLYMLGQFDEIRGMRALGLGSGRPVDEVYPVLEPVVSLVSAVGVPLDEISYAFIVGVIGMLLVLEATRRTLGFFLMALVAMFIVYARWGYLLPTDLTYLGALAIPELAWTSIVRDLWFTDQGVFGTPVQVSVRFIYVFVLFGAFLEMSGAGKWFIDLAYSLTGTKTGGPAKASVVASGFMGMLSGSSVANTVTTGAFTIPLMKRSGYSPEFSGAVESSVSSGGQLLPPVMGAAAFLIVEFTGTPFSDVIVAAALPAIAFFFGMWVMVHLEASRHGIGGLDRSQLANLREHFVQGWFYLLPLFLLLYFLIGLRLSIGRSGWLTIVAVVALIALIAAYNERTRVPLLATVTLFTLAEFAANLIAGVGLLGLLTGAGDGAGSFGAAVESTISAFGVIALAVSLVFLLVDPNRDSPLLDLDPAVDSAARDVGERIGRPDLTTSTLGRFGTFVVKSMDSGARTATTVVIAVAAAGVIPGVIAVGGLGPNLAALIRAVSADSYILLLLLIGVSSIILGMGMPTTVMYIIIISMLGTTLQDFGLVLLAAHLFVLYFGLMADVTPPVAIAAFAAAGVAKADEFKTGVIAFMLSLNKILVPFAFVFSPGILLLRDGRIMGAGDLLDLSYSIPEVLVPIVGMFVGVYAMGVAIIGYYEGEVSNPHRVLFGLSSVMLMAPMLLLLVVQDVGRAAGVWFILDTLTFDLALRGVGVVLFAALLKANRGRQEEDERQPAAGTVTD